MKLNKEETHKQGQNKAPEHQASSHTSLQNQDLSKYYKIHKYLILINPTVHMYTKQWKIPQQYVRSGISKAADRKVPLTDTS